MIKVLKGGMDEGNPGRYRFISGIISDTRLMGVVGMHAAYLDLATNDSVYVFFYFDYEEYGIDHIKILRGISPKQLAENLTESFSGLGAELNDITQRQAEYMAEWMRSRTLEMKQALPREIKEVEFMLAGACDLEEAELKELRDKICVPIKSDYGAINYYLMRCFGKDEDGAKYLTDAGNFEDIAPKSHSSFLLNKIKLIDGADRMHKSYRCESVIDVDEENRHHYVISEIEVYKRKVVGAKKISDMPISLYEVGVLLNKTEYVTVYEIKENADIKELVNDFAEFIFGMAKHSHEAGKMFIDYNKNNHHVENKIFRLNDDVNALFFFSGKGQILAASYSMEGIIDTEARLLYDKVGQHLLVTGRYTFAASVMYDFAESGYADFNDFLNDLE